MKQDLARLKQQMAKVKPWAYVAVALALLLGAFYAFQGMQYYDAQGIPFIGPSGNIATLTQEKDSIEQELAKQEAPPSAPDLTPIMDVLETLTWNTLDDEAWREVIALLVERVDVLGLNDYRLTWTGVGLALGRVLERV